MNQNQPSPDETIDKFWETIPPLWHNIRAHIRAAATEQFGITVEQFHILRHIYRGKGSVSELANAKRISRPAISQAVEVLVNKGLISRSHSAIDRRFVQLELTETGRALLDSIFTDTRQWMRVRLADLDATQLETLNQAMEIFKASFGEPLK